MLVYLAKLVKVESSVINDFGTTMLKCYDLLMSEDRVSDESGADTETGREAELDELLRETRSHYLRVSSPKIPGHYVARYFQLLSDYYHDDDDEDSSTRYSVFSEYASLLASGKIKKVAYPNEYKRYKELMPRFGSRGDLKDEYTESRDNFEGAISRNTPISGSPIKSKAQMESISY